jgi:hypothetical protein
VQTDSEVARPELKFDPMRELPPAMVEDNDWHYEVERRVRRVEAQVRARPITIVGAAMLAGFIVGRMLRD